MLNPQMQSSMGKWESLNILASGLQIHAHNAKQLYTFGTNEWIFSSSICGTFTLLAGGQLSTFPIYTRI